MTENEDAYENEKKTTKMSGEDIPVVKILLSKVHLQIAYSSYIKLNGWSVCYKDKATKSVC